MGEFTPPSNTTFRGGDTLLRIDLNKFRRNGWNATQGNGFRIVLRKQGFDSLVTIFDGNEILYV